MGNNSTSTKFDDKIKQVLSNYQADFDTNDWAKMDSKLNAVSSSNTFNSKYIIRIAVAIALLAGVYFAYTAIDWTKSKPTETIVPEAKIEKKTEPPVVKKEIIIPPVVDTASKIIADTITEKNNEAEIEKELVAEKKKIEKENAKKEKIEKEKTTSQKLTADKNKKTDKNKNHDDDGIKPEKVYTMGNEPIFGDMLDSSRGIIGRTKESTETKKAAQSKADVPIGWNQFMLKNVNVDSLRSYRAKKDSIK